MTASEPPHRFPGLTPVSPDSLIVLIFQTSAQMSHAPARLTWPPARRDEDLVTCFPKNLPVSSFITGITLTFTVPPSVFPVR